MNVSGRWLPVLPLVLIVCVGVACETKKSSNPLTPTVAGPMPGVTIAPPQPVDPTSGEKVAVNQQPITLVVDNVSTNSPRPMTYVFEVATDAGFTNKVFTRQGITPGANRTSLRLPDPLATGRSYYWHSRAQDGANTGPFSAPTSFTVFTPVVIDRPELISPANNQTVTSQRPTLRWNNAARTGPAGAIRYEIEVAGNDAFANRFDDWTVGEAPNQTSAQLRKDAPAGASMFWHVRAFDSENQGPWSQIRVFVVPTAPTGGGGGGGGGGGNPATCGAHPGHVAQTAANAQQIVIGTSCEFPGLTAVFPSDQQALNAAQQLLLRMIWHLHQAGFNAGRQRNPSGLISNDKLTIFLGSSVHAYDVMSLGFAGHATTVQFFEVFPANYIPDPGIVD